MATTDKYDRQLRLWGASGQRALAETCVVLLRATAAGTETLKNLVLPGIGAFMIVDDVLMTSCASTEFTSNFFLTAVHGGDTTTTTSSRAQMATEHLQELNFDVKGSFHDISSSKDGPSLLQFVQSGLVALIHDQILHKKSSSSLSPQSSCSEIKNILVVASDLEPNVLLATSRTCQAHQWPLIAVHSYGLLGIVRLQVSHPMPLYNPKRTSPPDLRLATLFRGGANAATLQPSSQLQRHLQELYNTIGGDAGGNNWDKLTSQQHGHVPYPLILMKIQNEWINKSHHAHLPSTFAEKQAFQSMVQQAARDFSNELNFQEAQRNAYLAYNTGEAVDAEHLQRLVKTLKQQQEQQGKLDSSGGDSNHNNGNGPSNSNSIIAVHQFLIMLEALQDFLSLHQGQAPLQGTIPDMTASTNLYVQLQTIYRNQAKSDWQEMRRLIDDKQKKETAAAVVPLNNNNNNISDEDLSTFCQNVHVLDIFQTRTLCQEYNIVKEDEHDKPTTADDDDDDFDELCQDLSMAGMEVAGDGEECDGNCSNSDDRPEMLPLFWYLGFRACQLFHQCHGRYPGTILVDNNHDNDDKKYLQDVPLLQSCLEKVVQAYKLQDLPIVQKVLLKKDNDEYNNKVATELTRYAQAEIHNIASVVGGVASQEAVKLITGQYVPLHHTYVYNGIASTGGVYKF